MVCCSAVFGVMILKPAAMARFCLFSVSLAQLTANTPSAITARNFSVVSVCLISSVLSRFSVVLVPGFSGRKGLSPAFRICGLFRFQKQYKSGSVNFRFRWFRQRIARRNERNINTITLRAGHGLVVAAQSSVLHLFQKSVFSKSSVLRGFRNEDSKERLGQIPWSCLWDFGPISRRGMR